MNAHAQIITQTPEIVDMERYNTAMRASLSDKLWFLEKLPQVRVWGDYGCADGSMLEAIAKHYELDRREDATVFGYDVDTNQVEACKARGVKAFGTRGVFFAHLNDLRIPGRRGLIFSSVLHEMNSTDRRDAFSAAARNDVDYIVIRDMATPLLLDGAVPSETVDKIVKGLTPGDMERLTQFETAYGPIRLWNNMHHFLLKYRFVEDWDRELQEYYLVNPMWIVHSAKEAGYSPIYTEHFQLPWIIDHVRQTFDVELSQPTHFKMILRKLD